MWEKWKTREAKVTRLVSVSAGIEAKALSLTFMLHLSFDAERHDEGIKGQLVDDLAWFLTYHVIKE